MARIPVECIAEMKPGCIRPIRLRYEDREGAQVIQVDNVISKDSKKVYPTMNTPASIEYSFKCETKVGGMKKPFTLIFNNQSCKWSMFVT